jgi:hypothetical protein
MKQHDFHDRINSGADFCCGYSHPHHHGHQYQHREGAGRREAAGAALLLYDTYQVTRRKLSIINKDAEIQSSALAVAMRR